MTNQWRILWVDDEIEILKPHILFLQQKGYFVQTCTNGHDAIDEIQSSFFDIILLDENMPGISGIDTLLRIKTISPGTPVVMITKSEEEQIMEEAIGQNIADYLIKPVNPNQILLTLKKNLEDKRLRSEKTTRTYQQEFSKIGMEISPSLSSDEWKSIYRKLVYWELELEHARDESVFQILQNQKEEANNLFCKYYQKNYVNWLKTENDNKPLLSHNLLKSKLLPLLDKDGPVFLVLIDNLRYDQWKVIQPLIEERFRTIDEDLYFSILPTATQFARNALFAGMMPTEIQKRFPQYWNWEDDDSSKNQYEGQLLGEFLKRYGRNIKFQYSKILNLNTGRKYLDNINNLMQNKLNVLVYNFVDMLSHAKTDMEIIKELASDEAAYRSITRSWFDHSPLSEMFDMIASKRGTILLTTDHGSIRVKNPVRIMGDRETNTNIRFKFGKSLNADAKSVYEIRNPADIYLPRPNLSTSYMFCRSDDFFVYPNNYNSFVSFFNDTFQHGGISMEEIIIPSIVLQAK